MLSPKDFNNIIVLTGAGVSAESGVNTYRDSGGLWENYSFEEVATPEAFKRDPELVQGFYNARRAQLKSVSPNLAHQVLADFERGFEGEFLLVTQNVDDLHQRAGSKNVLAMHGELSKVRCLACENIQKHTLDITVESSCDSCSSKGQLRPHIVWFGEIPRYLDEIQSRLRSCDLIVVIGTSCSVYPAAGFITMVSPKTKRVYLNLAEGEMDFMFDEKHYGPASKVVKDFFSR